MTTPAGDWADLRALEYPVKAGCGWCTGAPGVGLARLRAGDPAAVERAVPLVRAKLGKGPDHLCCGAAARAWFLAAAGVKHDRPDWLADARAAGTRLLADYRANGCWHLQPCHERHAIPGLMGGLAGMGLLFLHLHRPGAISPALTLG